MNNNSKNFLTYSIATERLYGTVGGQEFSMHAWSGGGRGQTGDSAEHNLASYDVSRKTKNKKIFVVVHYLLDTISATI